MVRLFHMTRYSISDNIMHKLTIGPSCWIQRKESNVKETVILMGPTVIDFFCSRRLYQFVLRLSNPGSRHHLIQFVDERMSIRSGSTFAVL